MKINTFIEIDLQKLKSNTNILCKSYSDYKYKFVDLKDNGHGIGLKIIDTMNQNGINYCLVGSLKEALEIRKFNRSIAILLNGYVSLEEIYDCINNNITITIYDLKMLESIMELKLKDKLNVHIIIDNGSNLIGIKTKEELDEIVKLLQSSKYLNLEGIYTKITSMGIEDEFYYHQINNFLKIIDNHVNEDLIIHLNEPIMYHHKHKNINGIRFDLSILGIEENIKDDFFTNLKIKNIENKYQDLEFPNIDLQLIFNIISAVADIRFVKKNSIIGKNYLVKNDMLVAIVPIGYKDGITKKIKYVGINGYKREILADDIDHIFVKVDEQVQINDKVYILNEEREIYNFLELLNTNRSYLMSILNRGLENKFINEENIEGSLL